MSDDDAPKTAYEIILERLKKKDREEGVEERPVSNEQKAGIAELRKVYEARLAEREILYQSSRRKAADLEALEKLEEEYRRDRERIASERDRKIAEVRSGRE
ncbi:MAG TPA: hypothetical protein VLF95_13390 [Vicinamibacteria bacterium]|nr:hypothetical protein [Vicinamibacteria bacterium]